ncbi:metal ABC transporter solute-binding protein, Zn/Mn family [Spiribacter halobius]|uniref:High-affinity zinc uptake system protein ZnuA n=1 Tax=Sediminicurvatus halobius TaxID=2182432 RepID=A0A2U2N5G9_9GAMM|nr:zinc ABC transporter substrate-binding protein [Spiribacter halobius]PWG64333.1 ABC transporter substrate-binding protein [Spiribacter halobius]UEX79323.1 zinc ABC transporter substrate-binding protein [Spiribacter halobius]
MLSKAILRAVACLPLLALLLPVAATAQPLEVAVSVLPQKHFVERIGGERVRVTAMVQPGQSPHTYEPSPRQVATIADADVYFSMGVGFETAWLPRLRETSPEMRIVDLRKGIAMRAIEGHGHGGEEEHDHASGGAHGHRGEADHTQEPHEETGHGHEHAGEHGDAHAPEEPDPHVWTDPRNVITMAATIRDTLSELDPDGAGVYRQRFEAYRDRLRELDAELESMLADIRQRRFMVYHPSWGYFADRYGLEQLPIELEGKEPGPASLARVVNQAREAGVRVIFVQPQFSERSARRVAEAIDGEVVAVDPLAEDYAANLRRVARAFRAAMQ